MPFDLLTGVRLRMGIGQRRKLAVKSFLQTVQVEEIKLLLHYSYQQALAQSANLWYYSES